MSDESESGQRDEAETQVTRAEFSELARQILEDIDKYRGPELRMSPSIKRLMLELGLVEDTLPLPTSGHEDVEERKSAEILARVRDWAGGDVEAGRWYRSQPIAAFGDRTAESLVKSGQAEALRDYLDSIALGGYA